MTLDNPSAIRIFKEMVASTPIPDPVQAFRPDPERLAQFIEALASPDTSLQQLATACNTTVGALCLFMESDAGLELLGGIEFALSTRLRVVALSALPAVAATLTSIVHACPRDEAADALPSDITSQKILEFKRNNARRAAALLIRMGTHRPRTVRPSAVRSDAPSQREGDGGWVGAAHTPSEPSVVAQTCGTSKRPLGRGEASDLDPVPPVRGSGTTGVLNAKVSSSPCSTPTTSQSSSAVVVHVGAANTPLRVPTLPIASPLGQAESTLVASMPRRIPSRASALSTRAGSAFPAGP